jgi:hypothetical protein
VSFDIILSVSLSNAAGISRKKRKMKYYRDSMGLGQLKQV